MVDRTAETVLHADGALGDGRVLCGLASEGLPDEMPEPLVAMRDVYVTCSRCKQVIAWVHGAFTPNGKARV